MVDPSSTLARAADNVEKFNRTLDAVCYELDDLDRPARSCGRQLSNAKSARDIGQLHLNLKTIAFSVSKLQQDNKDQKTQLDTTKASLRSVEARNRQLQRENDQLTSNLDDLPSQLREAKRKITKLKQDTDDLSQQLVDAGSDSSALRAAKQEIKDLKREIRLLKGEKQELEREKASLSLEKQALKKQNEDLQMKVDMYGPKPAKEPSCRGCQKRVRHVCSEFGNRWMIF